MLLFAVHWANDKKDETICSKYIGTAYALSDGDIAYLAGAGYTASNMAATVIVQYDDCTAEFFNLEDLSYRACRCTAHCNACLGATEAPTPASHHRVTWTLKQHDTMEILDKRQRLLPSRKPVKVSKRKRKQPKKDTAKTKAARMAASDSSSDDDELPFETGVFLHVLHVMMLGVL